MAKLLSISMPEIKSIDDQFQEFAKIVGKAIIPGSLYFTLHERFAYKANMGEPYTPTLRRGVYAMVTILEGARIGLYGIEAYLLFG